MSISGFNISAVIPINASSIQWIVTYSPDLQTPRCTNSSNTFSGFIYQIGDTIAATNRCYCSPVSIGSPASCQYYAIDATTGLVYLYSCGSDTTCTSDCTLLTIYPGTGSKPCAPIRVTNASSVGAYATSAGWDSSFNTSNFAYYPYALGDGTCSTVAKADRVPIYPNCTWIAGNVYGLTILNTTTGKLDQYGCNSAYCGVCWLSYSISLNASCVVDTLYSGPSFTQYRQGAILSNPNQKLLTDFPNSASILLPFVYAILITAGAASLIS
ncbi:uncharacterized protein BJ171DRAFT_567324 [Polychytrium aggregatum]|uniref:uncharacterized protein n=1 Tax=Polychytrium aggregatum TaxID=110093 RepID=UPI0022FDBE21|nr:uncharacterized protein BJ171DRAFT_567324 [Polychytrium aggregatum]KAI9205555.1 hypothetical protein BJ171DRAFT_567324 [Polychytrium aggregatum]